MEQACPWWQEEVHNAMYARRLIKPDSFSAAGLDSLRQHHGDECRRRARHIAVLFGGTYGLILAVVAAFRPLHPSTVALIFPIGLALAGILSFACAKRRAYEPAGSEELATVLRLAEQEDVCAIGPLLEELGHMDFDRHALVMRALTRLLPRLQQEDEDLLSPDQRACLHAALREATDATSGAYNVEFAVAALATLRHVGDHHDLRLAQRLAKDAGHGVTDARIRRAAAECVEGLQDRFLRMRHAGVLLRPAEAPADTLLRPVENNTPPEQLLRPRP